MLLISAPQRTGSLSCLPEVCSHSALTPVLRALKSQEAALGSVPSSLQHLGAHASAMCRHHAPGWAPQEEWLNAEAVALGRGPS